MLTPWRSLFASVVVLALLGCEEEKPAAPPPARSAEAEDPPEPPREKPRTLPNLIVTGEEVKVGYELILLDKNDGPKKLTTAVQEAKEFFAGQKVTVVATRPAKVHWLTALLKELSAAGATSFLIRTETRKEFPGELTFEPAALVKDPPPCTAITQVLKDRGTAVWKLAGGTAMKRQRGFAGPDLSMTADLLESAGKGCKDSTRLYVSGAEGIEWGLVYDLAASATLLEKFKFEKLVLVPKVPVAGRKVDTTE